jgi:hypothetical protein
MEVMNTFLITSVIISTGALLFAVYIHFNINKKVNK